VTRPITKPAKSAGTFPFISAASAVKAPLAAWLSPEWSLLAMGDWAGWLAVDRLLLPANFP
jgi:hypothetical protein